MPTMSVHDDGDHADNLALYLKATALHGHPGSRSLWRAWLAAYCLVPSDVALVPILVAEGR